MKFKVRHVKTIRHKKTFLYNLSNLLTKPQLTKLYFEKLNFGVEVMKSES